MEIILCFIAGICIAYVAANEKITEMYTYEEVSNNFFRFLSACGGMATVLWEISSLILPTYGNHRRYWARSHLSRR